jgi:hypothetical protein
VACSGLSIIVVRYVFSGRPGRRLEVMVADVVSDTELTSEEVLHSHTLRNTAGGVPFLSWESKQKHVHV